MTSNYVLLLTIPPGSKLTDLSNLPSATKITILTSEHTAQRVEVTINAKKTKVTPIQRPAHVLADINNVDTVKRFSSTLELMGLTDPTLIPMFTANVFSAMGQLPLDAAERLASTIVTWIVSAPERYGLMLNALDLMLAHTMEQSTALDRLITEAFSKVIEEGDREASYRSVVSVIRRFTTNAADLVPELSSTLIRLFQCIESSQPSIIQFSGSGSLPIISNYSPMVKGVNDSAVFGHVQDPVKYNSTTFDMEASDFAELVITSAYPLPKGASTNLTFFSPSNSPIYYLPNVHHVIGGVLKIHDHTPARVSYRHKLLPSGNRLRLLATFHPDRSDNAIIIRVAEVPLASSIGYLGPYVIEFGYGFFSDHPVLSFFPETIFYQADPNNLALNTSAVPINSFIPLGIRTSVAQSDSATSFLLSFFSYVTPDVFLPSTNLSYVMPLNIVDELDQALSDHGCSTATIQFYNLSQRPSLTDFPDVFGSLLGSGSVLSVALLTSLDWLGINYAAHNALSSVPLTDDVMLKRILSDPDATPEQKMARSYLITLKTKAIDVDYTAWKALSPRNAMTEGLVLKGQSLVARLTEADSTYYCCRDCGRIYLTQVHELLCHIVDRLKTGVVATEGAFFLMTRVIALREVSERPTALTPMEISRRSWSSSRVAVTYPNSLIRARSTNASLPYAVSQTFPR